MGGVRTGVFVAALAGLLSMSGAASAQIPPEWPPGAQAVLTELEKGTPLAGKPFGAETRQGWNWARAWRLHNNRNTEIVLTEYFAFVALCRWHGCGDAAPRPQPAAKDKGKAAPAPVAPGAVAGKPLAVRASEVKAERAKYGPGHPSDAAALLDASLKWLSDLQGAGDGPKKNVALWSKDKDLASADFAISNIWTLGWILARAETDPKAQAETMARFGLFVNGKAWIGDRCLDITKVAVILDAPPKVEACK